MTFTLEHLEFYLLILMRVSGFIMTAPFFSYSSVPMRIRAAMSVFMSLVVIQVTPVVDLTYSGGVWIFSTRFERIYDWCGSWIDVQYVFLHY